MNKAKKRKREKFIHEFNFQVFSLFMEFYKKFVQVYTIKKNNPDGNIRWKPFLYENSELMH